MDQEIYIHIGLHKTATTYLQQSFFPLLEGVNYLPPQKINSILTEIATKDQISFNYEVVRNKFNAYNNSGKPILISSENLSGHPALKYMNREMIFLRLKRIFPNCKIIIGLREQWSLISSMYKHYIHKGGTKSFSEYVYDNNKTYNETYFGIYNRISLETFKFSPLLDFLVEKFKKKNIHIFNFKNFLKDKEEELTKITNFLEVKYPRSISFKKVNESIPWDEVDKFRFSNRICRSYYHEAGILSSESRINHLIKKIYDLRKGDNLKSFKEYETIKELNTFKEDLVILKNKYSIEI